MHILLLQNSPCISDFSERLIKKFPRSSVVKTGGTSFPPGKPVLSRKWLIVLTLTRSFRKQIMEATKISKFAIFIFITHNKVENIQQELKDAGFDYQLVDNLHPDREALTKFVKDELGIADPLARHIVDRSNRYEPLVIKNIKLLKLVTYKQLTKTDVDRYLQDNSGASFSYLYRYILLGEGEYKKVVELVFRYQNAPFVLCKYLIDKLAQDYNLFLEIIDGNLSKENHLAFAETRKLDSRMVYQTILLFNSITLETLYAKRLLYESLLGKNCVEFILKGCR